MLDEKLVRDLTVPEIIKKELCNASETSSRYTEIVFSLKP